MKKITQQEFNKSYKLHGKWLRSADWLPCLKTGVQMDFSNCDLTNIDFPVHAKLQKAILRGANLRGANLRGTDLRGADLRGADIDYSCLSLWRGLQGSIIDEKILGQLITHICAVEVPDSENFKKIKDFLQVYKRD